jgi:hypothetical protein
LVTSLSELLYDKPELLILLALLGLLLVAADVGYRLGRRKRMAVPETVRSQIRSTHSAFLGLFALLLGFTFAMALSRFDVRKEMVVREANTIGTAALRASVLPVPQRAEMAELFRDYIETRVEVGRNPNLPTPQMKELNDEASRLQDQLWRHAAAAAEADPRSVPAGLLLQALNEVIDVKVERDAALANHVPESVLILLITFAVMTGGLLGYGNGLAGARTFGTTAVFAVLIAVVILVIIDLDRPRRGLIRTGQKSMLDLQEKL